MVWKINFFFIKFGNKYFFFQQYEERDETLKRIAQLQAIVVATNSDLEDAHQKLESATKFAAHVNLIEKK